MGSLTLTRCFNHGQREAVARCPSCRRHYCRECVTEHDHKLLCASCIEALASTHAAKERRRWPFIPTVQLFAALFVLWISFYGVGRALLLIPSEFHVIESETFDDSYANEPEETTAEVPETVSSASGGSGSP